MSTRITDSAMYQHLWGRPRARAVFEDEGRLQGWLEVLGAGPGPGRGGPDPGERRAAIASTRGPGLLDLGVRRPSRPG